MSWDVNNGFVPRTFDEILSTLVTAVNQQYGTNYDTSTIQGTNLYKYFYAGIQIIMESEQYVSDLSGKLQSYIARTNQKILQPRGTVDGFINFIKTDGVLNTEGSFEPIETEDQAGKIKFAILLNQDDDDFENKKNKLIEYFHKYLSVGLYYFSDLFSNFNGDWDGKTTFESDNIVKFGNKFYKAISKNTNKNPTDTPSTWQQLTVPDNFISGTYHAINGQEFYYGFYLPRYYKLKTLTITLPLSANNNNYVMKQNEVQNLFNDRFKEYMTLGKNLEPESICSVKEFPFASRVIYEGTYADNNGTIHSFNNTPVNIPFDVKFEAIDPETIVVNYQ